MRSEGGSSMGEDETMLVARERRIMTSGRTESGPARAASVSYGGGMACNCSGARVEGRRSDEEMCLRDEMDHVCEGKDNGVLFA